AARRVCYFSPSFSMRAKAVVYNIPPLQKNKKRPNHNGAAKFRQEAFDQKPPFLKPRFRALLLSTSKTEPCGVGEAGGAQPMFQLFPFKLKDGGRTSNETQSI